MDTARHPSPTPAADYARHYRHPVVPGVDLLDAHYVRHAFSRHTHPTYTIAVIQSGIEEWHYPGGRERAGAGEVPLLEPDIVHTGHAATPDGWRYRVLYPSVELVGAVAGELGMPPGTTTFGVRVAREGTLARLLLAAHHAADHHDPLTADTALRTALAQVLLHHARQRPRHRPVAEGPGTVRRAAELLQHRMRTPPTLEQLAAELGTRPFPLLRAFRREHGLPPHAWLNQARVRQARRLLDQGVRPADVAAAVGFADQSHLTRHFRRAVGVGPGAYQRERTRPGRDR
ncbi:AraC family transcriptional regulator [Allostreptomyces psammosilenae]|uniref:AraC-like DNA-binding protein n=1 Tax=Allostreptomyces psammosilenae TaxID=1892865 RepID=A0A852ZP79_9ACTN|nr:AraC family transcriptional regulator [Allostreptomyces psammosilenae]NYI03070.1 AraC-like DNA-binding protein [Allostreptomyces psammosilenae]